jgi:tetratricopeptide (TPR) repeat protein
VVRRFLSLIVIAVWLLTPTFAATYGDEPARDAQLAGALKLHGEGRLQEALAAYARLIRENPSRADVYANRALVHEALVHLPEAIGDYSEALRLQPNSAELLIGRGLCHLARGDWEPARKDFDRAVQVDPKNAVARLARAVSHERLGRAEEASRDAQQAIELDPRCKQVLIRRTIAAQAPAISLGAGTFLSELAGDNDQQVQRARAQHRRFLDAMGGGYWDLDGRFKFNEDQR